MAPHCSNHDYRFRTGEVFRTILKGFCHKILKQALRSLSETSDEMFPSHSSSYCTGLEIIILLIHYDGLINIYSNWIFFLLFTTVATYCNRSMNYTRLPRTETAVDIDYCCTIINWLCSPSNQTKDGETENTRRKDFICIGYMLIWYFKWCIRTWRGRLFWLMTRDLNCKNLYYGRCFPYVPLPGQLYGGVRVNDIQNYVLASQHMQHRRHKNWSVMRRKAVTAFCENQTSR
jgi:hypothetical protein